MEIYKYRPSYAGTTKFPSNSLFFQLIAWSSSHDIVHPTKASQIIISSKKMAKNYVDAMTSTSLESDGDEEISGSESSSSSSSDPVEKQPTLEELHERIEDLEKAVMDLQDVILTMEFKLQIVTRSSDAYLEHRKRVFEAYIREGEKKNRSKSSVTKNTSSEGETST